jgi:hypothetical protein
MSGWTISFVITAIVAACAPLRPPSDGNEARRRYDTQRDRAAIRGRPSSHCVDPTDSSTDG